MANRFADIAEKLGLTPGRLEAVGQGAFGLGDELGAGLQAGMAALTPGMDPQQVYRQARFENRDILEKQREAEPILTPAIETISSLAATAPFGAAPVRQAANDLGVAAKLGAPALRSGVLTAMKAAAPLGAAFGYGNSTSETLPGQALDTALGAGTAAGTAGLLKTGANAALRPQAIRNVVSKLQTANVLRKIGPIGEIPEADNDQEEMARILRSVAPKPPPSSDGSPAATIAIPGRAARRTAAVESALPPTLVPGPTLLSRLQDE